VSVEYHRTSRAQERAFQVRARIISMRRCRQPREMKLASSRKSKKCHVMYHPKRSSTIFGSDGRFDCNRCIHRILSSFSLLNGHRHIMKC
jgi:hypothetical protein